MSLQLKRRIIITDSRGERLHDTGLVEAHSFVVGFLGALGGLISGGHDVIDIYGETQRTVPNSQYDTEEDDVLSLGNQGDELMGIVVGSGSTPETTADISLEARIGAAVLYPSNHHVVEVEDATTASLVFIRSFTNKTAAPVLIGETGIQAHDLAVHWWREITGYQTYPPYLPITRLRFEPYEWFGLLVRDIGPGYSVPAVGAASVQYALEIPKP